MKELEAYRIIMSDLPVDIKEAEAEAEKNDRISAGVTNGSESGMSASDKTAIFVRVSGTKTGMTYTQNLKADPRDVLMEALNNSEYAQEHRTEPMNGADEKDIQEYESHEQEHVTIEELLTKAAALEAKVREAVPEASHIQVQVSENLQTTGIVNSLGLDRTHTTRIAEAELVLTCEKGAHRTLELETSAHSVEDISEEYFLDKIKEWIEWPINSCEIESGNMAAVINGSVMCNIFLTAWQMFSGYQYQNKSTPFYEKLGDKLFSEAINISDCPDDSKSGYGRSFDCQGTSSKNLEIIKEGKFLSLMHNLNTSKALGVTSTGNGGRDVNLISDQTECKVIPSNFTLVPGEFTKEDLLDELVDGIYICQSYDMFHSVNTASGDFSIPCQGIYYCGGKVMGKVDGITMNGNIRELLQNTNMVGNDRTTVSMVMSKSFSISAASIYVTNLMVTGGQNNN